MSEPKKYFHYSVAKALHWLAGAIIAFNLLTGWKIGDFPQSQKEFLISIHSSIGITIFCLMLFRWWWRIKNDLYSPPGWRKNPAMLLQWILYPLVILQAVIGFSQAVFIDYDVRAFGFLNIAALAHADDKLHSLLLSFHGVTALLLIALVATHIFERSRNNFLKENPR